MDRTLVAPEGLTKMHFICVLVDTGILLLLLWKHFAYVHKIFKIF